MGCNCALTRLYGRAAPGQRVVEATPAFHGGNISTIGALSLSGISTGLTVPGAIDADTITFFVEELLAPQLKPGNIVILDNCSIHKHDDVEDAIEARGADLLFLPPYSPDFNPIELFWSKIKAILRSLKARTITALQDALTAACSAVSRHDIIGWFHHCGYRGARI